LLGHDASIAITPIIASAAMRVVGPATHARRTGQSVRRRSTVGTVAATPVIGREDGD
jgi:hypothetical protein